MSRKIPENIRTSDSFKFVAYPLDQNIIKSFKVSERN